MKPNDYQQQTADQATRRIQLGQQTAPANDALREIAGRLKRLPYRDIVRLENLLNARLPLITANLGDIILEVADELEKA